MSNLTIITNTKLLIRMPLNQIRVHVLTLLYSFLTSYNNAETTHNKQTPIFDLFLFAYQGGVIGSLCIVACLTCWTKRNVCHDMFTGF